MNRKQRRGAQVQNKSKTTIKYAGKSYTISEAGALALSEHARRNFQMVVDIYDRILACQPDYAVAYNGRGEALLKLKRYDEALASCDKAIALEIGFAEAHHNRGRILQGLRRFDDALASYDVAVTLKPAFPDAHNNRGNTLQELKRFDEAMRSFSNVIALKPDHAEAYHNIGMILANKGAMQQAEVMYEKSLVLRPGFANTLYNLAHIRKYKDPDNADVKRIRQVLANPGISPRAKERLYYALGKIYDDCDRYDEAFECFRQANEIRGTLAPYKPEATEESTRGIREIFTRDFLAHSPAWASDSSTPVFIVGMPRSGTTLMASILSNHPDVDTAGELPTITEFVLSAAEWTDTSVPYPYAVCKLTPEVGAKLIGSYEKRLWRDAREGVKFIVDKHPINFRYLGLITLLFPKARVIHCMRNPLDTCLSNYFQCFTPDYDYSFNLGNTGHYYNEYLKVMAHWREALPEKMIEIHYEDMVADTERVARDVLGALGLAWNERCLAPHTNPSAVDTASHWQVRQPIYKNSMERWRHYEQHLAPLKGLSPDV